MIIQKNNAKNLDILGGLISQTLFLWPYIMFPRANNTVASFFFPYLSAYQWKKYKYLKKVITHYFLFKSDDEC